ncbi:hypothetical protein D0860_01901 [Hortaea werneckii]|uniref:DUF6590 domain-containing protein n=1 Tax=Hortaea werneckii TaxID=91943 RepID=A0A3M7HNM1_HORWE|nr:hypothetical protein D0860_01901 [Hortaea werneckii]
MTRSRGKNASQRETRSSPLEQENAESHSKIWHELKAVDQTLDRLKRLSMWMLIPVISSAVGGPDPKAAEAKAIAGKSVKSFLAQLRRVEGKASKPSATVEKADERFIARITEADTHRLLHLIQSMKTESARDLGLSQSSSRPTMESSQSPVASDPMKPGFRSTSELEKHLKSSARHHLEERDIRVILKFAQFSRPEDRTCCPFCWVQKYSSKLVEHMGDHFEKLAIRAFDDCKPLLDEEEASTGAFRQEGPMVFDEGQQKRADESTKDIAIHKSLSRYAEGIGLLDTNYKTRPGRWFKWGHVIKVTNVHEASTRKETSGSGAATEITDIVEGVSKTGGPMLVPARWFLIIKESKTECYCLRISTYGCRGVSKLQSGLYKKHHSPVYSTREPPELLPEERLKTGEDPMQEAIAVESARDAQSLDVTARLLWTRVYKVSHNVEAALFGRVRPRWESKVEALFKNLNPHSTLRNIRPDHMKVESSSLKDFSRPVIVKPQYRPGDWVQFAIEGPKQTVIRWQVTEAHLSSGQWKYKLKDSGTGKQFQMEKTSRTSPTGQQMICKEI